MTNRLASERSPYLLQHADNPVDWYAWGEEAFARARASDRPIFLSIGYSTCHWCHVMAHESFESAAIAEILNREFVPIKVDREERPDVDHVYMTFVQATTGSGGWPMSVWLLPDRRPFFGGTYFPPRAQWGRPGFGDVLGEIARVWKQERARVEESAESITKRLQALAPVDPGARVSEPAVLGQAVEQFRRTFDEARGGFGGAPKFPRPAELFLLLREHARTGDRDAQQMALKTLQAMALGGMRDHVGGGFHRYSVDADWRVPHFEKMLYDQAQLSLAYLEAAQSASDPFYAEVAADTLRYVAREMTDPAGGFYSAEDADSLPPERTGDPAAHMMEGAFYVWREQEMRELLGADAAPCIQRFGIRPDGNAPADPQGEFTGKNLLYLAQSIEEVGRATGMTVDAVVGALDRARVKLFEARRQRPRPHLDDKVLAAWNGLMIAAFARASRVLDLDGREREGEAVEPTYLQSAQRAAHFIKARMWGEDAGTLRRRYRAGEAGIDAYAEDYAFLIWGVLELFQADSDPVWLEWALRLQTRQDALFWDEASGGWFSTTGRDASVLVRVKEDYDGAEPAASSISVWNLLTLAHLTGDPTFQDRIARTFKRVASRLPEFSRGMPMMLSALSMFHAGLGQIAIVGDPDGEDTRRLTAAVRTVYLPFSIVVAVRPGAAQDALARLLRWVGPLVMRDGRATAYVCRDFVCQEPVTTPDALLAQLRAARGSPSAGPKIS